MTINKSDIKVIVSLCLIGLMIFFAHFLLLRAFPESLYAPGILYIHPFLFILTTATILVLNFIFKKVKLNLFGYAFLASGLIKMLISVLFLIPILKGDSDYKKIYVIQFFMIYFMYLAMEVVYLVQKLKDKKT